MKPDFTNIKVSKKLTEKLKDIGGKSETYEDIIWRLLEEQQNGKRGY
jgi:hypothetical protein